MCLLAGQEVVPVPIPSLFHFLDSAGVSRGMGFRLFIHRPYSGAKRIVRTRHRTLWFAKQFWKCGMMDQLLYLNVHPFATGRKIFEPVVWTDAKTLRCRLPPHTSRGVWPARIKQEWACLPGLVEHQPEQTNQSLVGSKGVWFRGPDCDALECPKWSEFNDVCLFSASHVGFKPQKRNETFVPGDTATWIQQLYSTAQNSPKIHFSNIHLLSHFPSLAPPKPPNLPQQNHVKSTRQQTHPGARPTWSWAATASARRCGRRCGRRGQTSSSSALRCLGGRWDGAITAMRCFCVGDRGGVTVIICKVM